MGRSFADSTAAELHGGRDDDLALALRGRFESHAACRYMRQERFERMLAVASRRLSSLTVVLENLADTHNCSAVLRSAEGLGLDTVHVVEQPRRFRRHPQILKGADRWIDVVRHGSIESCLAELNDRGFSTWAADVGPGCVPVDELDVSGPVAIVMGTEMEGLTDRARALTDGRFTLPMYGFTGSFNVSVSAAVALSHLGARRRRLLGTDPELGIEAAAQRLQRWLDREVQRRGAPRRRNATALLAR